MQLTKSQARKRLAEAETKLQKAMLFFDWTKCGKRNSDAAKDYMTVQKILEKWYMATK